MSAFPPAVTQQMFPPNDRDACCPEFIAAQHPTQNQYRTDENQHRSPGAGAVKAGINDGYQDIRTGK